MHVCSIVAVHGLSGHRTESWSLSNDSAAKNKRTWLKSQLPEEIPEAFVMTFGYDFDITTVSASGMTERALGLLGALCPKGDSDRVG
jgi:hypothetical protein